MYILQLLVHFLSFPHQKKSFCLCVLFSAVSLLSTTVPGMQQTLNKHLMNEVTE